MDQLNALLAKGLTVAAAVVVALVVQHFALRLARRVLEASDVPSASIFLNILRALIWSLAVLSILQPVFGMDPSGFVTALGEASVAISLGLQDTISNLISGLSLMAGKVIKPGDKISVGSVTGEVTDVTWRSTTVRHRSGDVEVIPNSVLNKTSLTHRTAWGMGLATVPIAVRPGADLDAVAAECRQAARDVLGADLDPAFDVEVVFNALTAYGTQGEVRLHVNEGVVFSSAQDRVTRALQGRPWLACALSQ